MFLLELPQRGNSNESNNIPFLNIKMKIILNYVKSATMGFIPRDPRTSSKTAVVNEPSVFEPLKFYCTFAQIVNSHVINRHKSMQ